MDNLNLIIDVIIMFTGLAVIKDPNALIVLYLVLIIFLMHRIVGKMDNR